MNYAIFTANLASATWIRGVDAMVADPARGERGSVFLRALNRCFLGVLLFHTLFIFAALFYKLKIIKKLIIKLKNVIFEKFKITVQTSTVRYQQRGKIFRDRSHTYKRSKNLKIDFV